MSIRVAAVLLGVAAPLAAAPLPFMSRIGIVSTDPGLVEIDRLWLTDPHSLAPGETATLRPVDALFAAAADVSYSVTTVGVERTISVTYATSGDPFVTQAAVSALVPPPPQGLYGIRFRVGFFDSDWDGQQIRLGYRLSGDDTTIVQVTKGPAPVLNLRSFTIYGFESPALPGFRGAAVVADQFTFTVKYGIPEPSTLSALFVCGIAAARRRSLLA